METVTTCFTLTYTKDQYEDAVAYVEDMKRHRRRVFWIGKEGKSDDELVYSVIAHRILSGFYNTNNAHYSTANILSMTNRSN